MAPLPKFRSLFGTFLSATAGQMLTLVTGVLVARTLQPEGRGIFAAVQIWPGIICSVGLLGINYSLALRAAKARGNLLPLARIGVGIGLGISGVIVAGLWFVGPLLLPSSVPDGAFLTHLYLFVLPATIVTTYLQSIDHGTGILKKFNGTRIAFNVFYLIAVIACWACGLYDVRWFILSLVVANLATVAFRIYLTGWRCLVPDFAFNEWQLVTKEGAPFLITSAVQIGKEYVERLVVLYFLAAHDLGLYVIAVTAASLHTTLGRSVNMLVLPRSGALSLESATRDTARIFRVMSLVSGVLSLVMMATLPFLIRMVFGPAFESAIRPAVILVLSQYLFGQGAIIDEGLRAQARPFVGMVACGASVVTFSTLAYAFVTWWGLTGVAIAAVCGQFVYCATVFGYLRRAFKSDLLPAAGDFRFLWNTLLRFLRRPVFGGPRS